jgi:hypothetical protein
VSTGKGRRPRSPSASPLPPTAPVGNLFAATHAAFSDRFVLPDADRLSEIVYAHAPHLGELDHLAVRDYCIAQIRAWRIADWLERNGDFDAKSRLRPAVEALRHWLDRAERARARLGLDPASRLALNVDESILVDRMRRWEAEDMEQGARPREAAERRLESSDT